MVVGKPDANEWERRKSHDRLDKRERRVRKGEMIYKEGKGGGERKDRIE